jgi:hypothetical protein
MEPITGIGPKNPVSTDDLKKFCALFKHIQSLLVQRFSLPVFDTFVDTQFPKPFSESSGRPTEFLSDFASGRYYSLSERSDRSTIAARVHGATV